MSEHEHDNHDDHEHDDLPYGEAEVHAHVGSYRAYFAVFMALIFFTLLTVGVASIHLGKANLAVAVLIASAKAALVCTFFMHLKDDNKFNSLILIAAITFIGVFFALTLNDVDYRTQLDLQSGNRTNLRAGTEAPGSWVNPVKKEEGAGAAGETKTEPAPTTTATASAQPTPAALSAMPANPIPSAAPSTTAATSASAAPRASAAPHASASAAPHAAPRASGSAAHPH